MKKDPQIRPGIPLACGYRGDDAVQGDKDGRDQY